MDRFFPLKTNATASPVLLIDGSAETSQLLENALLRIRAGTSVLQALTTTTLQYTNEADLFRLILSAYLPLQDGLDLLEQLQSKS
ncbi:hypothetical protein [Pseudomonas sp. lyk4-TYG-107]|uniref:hypothetical protein n=1 Tax=Pseudomonas sp. lyk4-TYG-107 TaxID=3040317 RepID=UPI002555EBA6|nr:hypothetical protein [Pseudomonas sp. lyk4-TYG-107]